MDGLWHCLLQNSVLFNQLQTKTRKLPDSCWSLASPGDTGIIIPGRRTCETTHQFRCRCHVRDAVIWLHPRRSTYQHPPECGAPGHWQLNITPVIVGFMVDKLNFIRVTKQLRSLKRWRHLVRILVYTPSKSAVKSLDYHEYAHKFHQSQHDWPWIPSHIHVFPWPGLWLSRATFHRIAMEWILKRRTPRWDLPVPVGGSPSVSSNMAIWEIPYRNFLAGEVIEVYIYKWFCSC